MTEQELEHIVSVKKQLDNMKSFAYGTDILPCKSIKITRLTARHEYSNSDFNCTKEVSIPSDLADEIMKLVKQRIEKLQEEFDNFKIE